MMERGWTEPSLLKDILRPVLSPSLRSKHNLPEYEGSSQDFAWVKIDYSDWLASMYLNEAKIVVKTLPFDF